MRRPKHDMFGLRISSRTKAAKMIRIAVVDHFIGGTSVLRSRPPDSACYAPRAWDDSLAAFGLILKDRDLGLLFLPADIVPEEKDQAERQYRQQELEEAFHRNLPSPHFI